MKARAIAVCVLALPAAVLAEERPPPKRIHDGIERGLGIVEKAARNYPTHRECFSCHHQTLPMLAMVASEEFGREPDKELLEKQAEFTRAFFARRVDRVSEGKSVGGAAATAAYALWALDLGGGDRDEVTDALVSYLVKTQEKDGRWTPPSHRPPLEESAPFTSFIAAHYLIRYRPEGELGEASNRAVEKATRWFADAETRSQEDLNAKFWAHSFFAGELADDDSLRDEILAAQKKDGGWSQLPDMGSDAYATGQTLYVLYSGGLDPSHPAMRRGVEFLLETQEEDGSWFVKTRSKAVQKYFDNGDPHGKSQFISIAATSWATTALAVLHKPPPETAD